MQEYRRDKSQTVDGVNCVILVESGLPSSSCVTTMIW